MPTGNDILKPNNANFLFVTHILFEKIKLVLTNAIESGGTTLRDFVREDGSPGYFKLELLVYGLAGEPCKNCGRTLTESRVGNRSTVFCSRCQR